MHPNEVLARREIELILMGEDEGVANLYASDFVLHYPGRNPLAGTYTDVGDFLTRLGELFEGGTVKRELHDALGTDDHAVQLPYRKKRLRRGVEYEPMRASEGQRQIWESTST